MFIVNVEGAIFKEERWLLIRRSVQEEHAGGTIALVGGKVELEGYQMDILEKTLHREIWEEVGIEVRDLHYVHSSSFELDNGTSIVDIVFLCEHKSGVPIAKSPDEVESVYWMTTKEVLHHPDAPSWTKESLTRAEKLRMRLI